MWADSIQEAMSRQTVIEKMLRPDKTGIVAPPPSAHVRNELAEIHRLEDECIRGNMKWIQW
jgi:hypothetical protein